MLLLVSVFRRVQLPELHELPGHEDHLRELQLRAHQRAWPGARSQNTAGRVGND